MSTIGQIVYNLQDTHSTSVLTSTKDNAITSTVTYTGIESEESAYRSDRINIYEGLAQKINSSGVQFQRLGIQAPPGTKIELFNGNNAHTVMIGRTGVYELDCTDKNITDIKFLKQLKWDYDYDSSKSFIDLAQAEYIYPEGKTIDTMTISDLQQTTHLEQRGSFEFAKVYFEVSLNNLDKTADDYYANYEEIHDQYWEYYQEALMNLKRGLNGIYKLPVPGNENDPQNIQEIYNVIIDYVY